MHLEGRDPCTAREEGKHPRKNGRSRGAYERTRMGEGKGRKKERDGYTHREATGQCWKVALLIRVRESERDREEDRGIG